MCRISIPNAFEMYDLQNVGTIFIQIILKIILYTFNKMSLRV